MKATLPHAHAMPGAARARTAAPDKICGYYPIARASRGATRTRARGHRFTRGSSSKSMFSFFKKFKKPADAPPGAPQDESVEAAEDEEISDAELERQALGIVPTPSVEPRTEESKEYWQGRTQSQWARGPETDQANEEIVPPPEADPAAKKSWISRLRHGLSKTSSNLTGIFVSAKIDEDLYEELETALLMSDAGVDATEFLLESLREKVRAERLTDASQVKAALRTLLVELLRPLEKSLMLGRAQPLVMMIAGVNGVVKTTSIGKLAKHLQHFNQSVLLAAGDTFRAAAREQLM